MKYITEKQVLELEKQKITWRFITKNFYQVNFALEIALSEMKKQKKKEVAFLDVGCGIGNILIQARQYAMLLYKDIYFICYGIEHNPALVKIIANQNLGMITHEDARQYNSYGTKDIIYYYWPIQNKIRMQRLERKIEREAKVGTIIIAFSKQSQTINKDKRFTKLGDSVYKKISN